MAAEDEKIVVSKGVAAILLLTSAVTGIMGLGLLTIYEASVSYYHPSAVYAALYVGALNFCVCAVCFAAGVASLKRRLFPLTAASPILLLASGIAAFIALGWLYGLLFGALQIIVSIFVLAALVRLKQGNRNFSRNSLATE